MSEAKAEVRWCMVMALLFGLLFVAVRTLHKVEELQVMCLENQKDFTRALRAIAP